MLVKTGIFALCRFKLGDPCAQLLMFFFEVIVFGKYRGKSVDCTRHLRSKPLKGRRHRLKCTADKTLCCFIIYSFN